MVFQIRVHPKSIANIELSRTRLVNVPCQMDGLVNLPIELLIISLYQISVSFLETNIVGLKTVAQKCAGFAICSPNDCGLDTSVRESPR